MYDYVVLKIFASESYKSNNTKGIVGKGASALLWTGIYKSDLTPQRGEKRANKCKIEGMIQASL